MKKYTFACGCEFPANHNNGIDLPEVEQINLNCPATWDMISKGLTWGVFQLEKGLGQKYSKLYKPNSIDEMGALQALIRPGTLDVKMEDGKSLTEHIC